VTSGLADETAQDRALSTDRDWEEWGKSDPYFGVLSSDEFHGENLDETALGKFFRTGEEHIDRVLRTIRERLDKDFKVRKCADLGCGVGRLVIPLAGISDDVVGIDVSESMLAEAQANCQKRRIENVSFVQSDDSLSRLSGPFNLVHTCLVLQHIPTARGMRILHALVNHLEPGGVAVIQFSYRCDAPKMIRALVKLRYRLPVANAARNLMRGRPLMEPAMQLHTYSLDDVVGLLVDSGVDHFYMESSQHQEFQEVTLYAQRRK
jgi:trans-aconitate methyltransferase